jgi:predicted DsbA family dithiol-disulfide isomerase
MSKVQVTYFSDVLCIWAYVAQARLDETVSVFGADVSIDHKFVSVFGDARTKIATAWKDRGGAEGYNSQVLGIAARFPHVQVDPRVWIDVQPASSWSPHLFLSALLESERDRTPDALVSPLAASVMWAFRRGFFAEGRDIGRFDVQADLARPFGVDLADVERRIADGTAYARLVANQQDAERLKLEGSPTFVLNEGRQKLYGNVGFRIIEANIRELLREPNPDSASWC